ncbi:CBS domain-containing protein [Oceanobacillus halophilus]|uniref:CBS domain-containing protein n=1 Tax=Oceanobacillus halophilus TaxID=930130 RepID=A0A495A3B8_9BACI|nr:CBS domain-containing protein [Oceanobacillus halophilus]RKQ33879.1 CBS domain-containing protein [Oceanobacillus halophilus]
MNKNSEVFLATFNRIEKELKSLLIHKKEVGFSKAVKILRNSNAIVKQYSDDLLEFAELRNAIIHNKTDATFAIAEPHDSIVESIMKIEKELTQPRRVINVFSRKVYTFQQDDTMESLLNVIREKQFTKFPIYRGNEFQGLITQKGITNWLAHHVNDSNKMMESFLEDVLKYEKDGNYKFISGDSSVYEAVEVFKEQLGKGIRLEALLITSHGKTTEKLAGIITNWDIMKVNA